MRTILLAAVPAAAQTPEQRVDAACIASLTDEQTLALRPQQLQAPPPNMPAIRA